MNYKEPVTEIENEFGAYINAIVAPFFFTVDIYEMLDYALMIIP